MTKPDSQRAVWKAVATVDQLDGDGPFALDAGGSFVVVLRAGGELRAFEGRCPHQGALLGEGELDGDTLVCRNHRWRFDGRTGQRVGPQSRRRGLGGAGAGEECLRACPLQIADGVVRVDVASLARDTPARARGTRTLADLPGPRGLPFVGNAFDLHLDRLHQVIEGWVEEHGPLFRFTIRRLNVVVVTDPALITDVLRARPESYRRSEPLASVFVEMGVDGVFSAEGEAWRAQRKLAMEALSHRHLRGFYPTLRTVAERLRVRWQGAASRGDVVDIQDDLMRFTVDVTTNLVFGRDMDTVSAEGDVLQEKLSRVLPVLHRRLFAVFPLWRYLRMPSDRGVDRALAELRVWLAGVVAEARTALAADPDRAAHPHNFIEAMIAARDHQGQPFSDAVLFGNAMTMLLAGEDTTANTLAWAVHELCDAPGAVAELRRGVDEALGDATVPGDFETADRLTFATAVANETMRLRPVAPLGFMQANEDVVIGDLLVPRGTGVCAALRVPALSPSSFGAPMEFRPARWLDGAPAAVTGGAQQPAALMPFGSGPRICPGRTLALVEMRVVLATLYRSFDVARVGRREDVRERFAFTMSPRGLRVRLHARPA